MALINAKAMPTNHTDYSNYIKVVACLTNYIYGVHIMPPWAVNACTHMHTHTYARTLIHTHMHAHARAHSHTHMHAHSYTCTLTNAHTRTLTHTCTHAHTHTHTEEKLPYMAESIYTLNKIRHSSNWVFVHWPAFIQSGGPLANIVKHLKDPPHYQKPSVITHHSILTRSRLLRNSICLDC